MVTLNYKQKAQFLWS